MSFDTLREHVCQANIDLVAADLVTLTWGNASGVDREAGVIVIKPSGVDYDRLRPDDLVVVALDTGEVVEGELRPSSDTPTHLVLYREFPLVGGLVHTHSAHATGWAQAGREIPCQGTTHADLFFGPVPITRELTSLEIERDYEANTGRAIVERFVQGRLDPRQVPGVLVPYHGPFAWGTGPADAVENAIILEQVARMALYTAMLNPGLGEIPEALLNKHFLRKHGSGAYYGQEG
ncbi:MAG: L-ribulose-5-phosphate 4-epimerase AraD [Candidatus Brocadiia bacterium]|jgi:L-ribulose-5-phosphate 4-epimerase|nr:L-ribulose-5-phosphate 4-epimerase AraD [Candidatus Brocadiia bacterium]